MKEQKKLSDWTDEEIKQQIMKTVIFFWIIGCSIIFVLGCVTYYYIGPIFGLGGQFGFQATGLLVAAIIAHYSYRTFSFLSNITTDSYNAFREAVIKEDEDDDVQE